MWRHTGVFSSSVEKPRAPEECLFSLMIKPSEKWDSFNTTDPFLSPSESFRWDILSTERQSCSVWRGDLTNSSQPRIQQAEKRQERISFTWNIDAPSKVASQLVRVLVKRADKKSSQPFSLFSTVSYIKVLLPLFWLLNHLISIFKRCYTQAPGITPKSTFNKKGLKAKLLQRAPKQSAYLACIGSIIFTS